MSMLRIYTLVVDWYRNCLLRNLLYNFGARVFSHVVYTCRLGVWFATECVEHLRHGTLLVRGNIQSTQSTVAGPIGVLLWHADMRSLSWSPGQGGRGYAGCSCLASFSWAQHDECFRDVVVRNNTNNAETKYMENIRNAASALDAVEHTP